MKKYMVPNDLLDVLKNILDSVPDLSFPMDVVKIGILQGSIEGTLVGNVNLIAGRHGNAMQTGGSDGYAEFPIDNSNKCLQNPDWCHSGVTFSMWLMKMPGNSGAKFRVYLSKACDWDIGFCVSFLSTEIFSILICSSSLKYRYRISHLPINKWQHVTFTFMPDDGIQLYINGCDAAAYSLEGYPLMIANTPASGAVSTYFRLGGGNSNSYAAHMKLDHILIWYDVLTADEVWQLYMQGGIM